MTRAVIYARVSSEEQAAEGKTSIQTQLDDCRALALKRGWVIVGEFTDDKRYRVGKALVEPSGRRTDRPEWRKMLAMLSEGRADALLAWHSSRLYRGYKPMADLLEILDSRPIQVELAKEAFNQEFAVLQAWGAKKENEARVARTTFGWTGRAKRGMSPTHTTPYFRAIREPDTGEALGYEFREEFRPQFDLMARMFLQRISYRDITIALGTNPRTGKRWGRETIRCIMMNAYYRGQIEYNKRSRKGAARLLITATHKPVWDAATCQAIEIELARRSALGKHPPRAKSAPFAGVLHCGWCGHVMSPSYPGHRLTADGRPYRYYYCYYSREIRRGMVDGPLHPPAGISESKLLRLLRDELEQLSQVDIDEAVSILASIVPARKVDDSETRRQIADLERQARELEADLKIVKSVGARAGLSDDLAQLGGQLALYRGHLASQAAPDLIDFERMRGGLQALLDNPDWYRLPDVQLKQYVMDVFQHIYIAGGQIVPAPPNA